MATDKRIQQTGTTHWTEGQVMRHDNRSKLQSKLERTSWRPFAFVTPAGAVVTNPVPAPPAYQAAADIATLAIIKMMFECRCQPDALGNDSTKS